MLETNLYRISCTLKWKSPPQKAITRADSNRISRIVFALKALTNQKKYDGFILKLEDRILALESAEDTNDVGKAMVSARDLMKKSVKVMSREKAIEIEIESRQMMDQIDQAGDVFAEVEDLDLDDDEYEAQLDELEAEELLGDEILPEIPDEPVPVKEKSKVKKDLENLKKELDIDD